jgi:hypothetical protein
VTKPADCIDAAWRAALRWAACLGGGFHPDNKSVDYTPPLTPAEVRAYDVDMTLLFAEAADPTRPRWRRGTSWGSTPRATR